MHEKRPPVELSDHKPDHQTEMDSHAKVKDVHVAFNVLGDDDENAPGYQCIKCHIVFDIKIRSFRLKVHLVAGGNVTDPVAPITYASILSRESIRIAFTIGALNDLDIQS